MVPGNGLETTAVQKIVDPVPPGTPASASRTVRGLAGNPADGTRHCDRFQFHLRIVTRLAGNVDVVASAEGQDYRELARSLVGLLEIARRTLTDEDSPSELVARVTGHLGCGLSDVVAVHERFPIWDHVNIYRGVEAYLADHGRVGAWFGIAAGMMRPHQDLLARLATPVPGPMSRAGSASYGTVPTGPDTDTEVVMLGLAATTAPGGAPTVIGMRAEREFGPPYGELEILAADRDAATEVRTEIARLSSEHNVFRGQVLSFTPSEHHGNELVTFLPRITLTEEEVVLPDGVLESIERHAAGIGTLSRELRDAGQHLKRGLLLYGPPGTGKTHTVRYLTGKLTSTTVILLTGRSIRFVEDAAALARRLQPSMVVLEDVDLIAQDRDFSDGPNPLLFTLLDAMDGVGSDADVTFVLTTNRADILERALADRPGRVDLAIEVPRPDAACRERLLRLYARGAAPDADIPAVVAATEGVTASYIKELVRRAVLAALRAGQRPLVLHDAHFDEVLAEMNSEHQSLTRSLLGGDATPADARSPGARRPRR
jgi:ATPase family associated with various cellular activities (AAA)